MIEVYANTAQTTLAANINATATSVTLLSGTGALFPNPTAGQFFRLTFNDALTGLVREITYCTARSGDTCTIVRGQEGTTAHSWLSGDSADNLPTAGAMSNLTQVQQVQQNFYGYASDNGSATAYVLTTPTGAMATPVSGASITFIAKNTNSGAATISIDGSSAYPLLGPGRAALQGGEILGNTITVITYDAASAKYVVTFSCGTLQAPTATQTGQVPNYGQTQATYAQKAGSATQPFSTSSLTTSTIVAANPNINMYSSNGVISYNLAGTGYVPVFGSTLTSNGLSYTNYNFTQSTYAQLAGSPSQPFQSNQFLGGQVNASGAILYLASAQYTASVNNALSGYVPHMVAAATNGQQAVNLTQADARYAQIAGNNVSFTVYNLYLGGNSIVENSGGAIYLQANGGVICATNGAAQLTPLQCAPGGGGNQAVNFSQFPFDVNYTGYVKLPNGFMIQWGRTQVGAGTPVNFPVAFPNACFSVAVSEGAASSGSWASGNITVHGTSGITNTGYTGWGEVYNSPAFTYGIFSQNFIAVGY